MATKIAELKGKIEIPLKNQVVEYKDSTLNLLKFNGGIERGRSLQLTIVDGDKTTHIQLNSKDSLALKNILNNEFNEN